MPIHQGEMLKKAVDASKLKIKEISQKSGVPVSSLYDLFKKVDVPRRKLEKLCTILGIEVDPFYWPLAQINDGDGQPKIFSPAEIERLLAENELLRKRIADMETIINLMNEKGGAKN